MFELNKVISGGQTGVDQAALRAARERGLALGGWCPPGRVCEAGIIPAHFPLQETPEDRSPGAPDTPHSQRTEWNARDSDATLIIRPRAGAKADPGTDWTQRCARRYKKPLLVCDPADPNSPDKIRQWLGSSSIRTLNVAGPGERAAPGIGDQAHALLVQVFSDD
jgi:hypothetical protein